MAGADFIRTALNVTRILVYTVTILLLYSLRWPSCSSSLGVSAGKVGNIPTITATLLKKPSAKMRLCGDRLMGTLKMICNHCYYNGPRIHRRRKRNIAILSPDVKLHFLANLRRRSGKSAAINGGGGLLYRLRRNSNDNELSANNVEMMEEPEVVYYDMSRMDRSLGIATRCCENQCSLNELKSYCCNRR